MREAPPPRTPGSRLRALGHVCLGLLSGAVLLGATGAELDVWRRIGMVDTFPTEYVLMIPDSLLAPGDSLTLIAVPDAGDSSAPAIGRSVILDRIPMPGRTGMLPEPGDVFYRMSPTGELRDIDGLCIALEVPRDRVRTRDSRVRCDLDGDGTEELLHSCASFEGVHLSVWTGPYASGIARWHRYYHVPYDTEPTCEDIDSLQIRRWRGEDLPDSAR